MRTQLLHLFGPLRGQTRLYGGERVIVGTAPAAAVRFAAGTPRVAATHAEIVYHPTECAFYLHRLEGRTFVNGREVEEVILQDDDLLEFGEGGPKARFRIHVEPGEVCKPVRQMLGDAAQVRRASGLWVSGQAFVRDLLTHATLSLKIGFPLAVAAVAFLAAWFGGWVGGRQHSGVLAERWRGEAARYETELRELREHSRLVAERQEQQRADLERRAAVVDQMVADNVALRRALDEYSRGVCLIEGAYGFQRELDSEPLRDPRGDLVELEYVGSGFLVSAQGDIVTNRHVAEPWFGDADAEAAAASGYRPAFVRLRAWFPGHPAFDIDHAATRLRPQDAIDVAVVRLAAAPQALAGIPALPISTRDLTSYKGGRVLVLGYPTGIGAMLARMESVDVKAVTDTANSLSTLVAELAARNAIAPLATQGALSEVLPARLIFDAETTHGGSGGPVFGSDGTVIGVTFAVLRGFGGSNLGVPIRYAMELLPK